MRDLIKLYALSFVGVPYLWGGDDPMLGFDCSGLAQELLKAAGVLKGPVDMTAQSLAVFFKALPNQPIEFGDLLFFGKSPQEITHVGFAMEEEFMLEAGSGGSKILTLKDAEDQNAYIRVRPISNRSDFQCSAKPPYKWKE